MSEFIDVWYIECYTGCTCCSSENFERGFYKNEEEPKAIVEKWLRGEENPLASQFARYGKYHVQQAKAEILPDGRMIVNGRVYEPDYLGDIYY